MSRSPSYSLKSEPTKLDPKSLRRWVVAFCIIRFDLEQGQIIEECYPPGCLTQEEELEIAFSSFPDSVSQYHNRSSIHDCIFFFRVPRWENAQLGNESSSKTVEGGDNKVYRRSSSICKRNGSKYLYGYVFNRQRQDERLKRGGEQKSVVILSQSPYLGVFRPVLQILGPLYFDTGEKALEYMASYVSMWPDPVLGTLMELPVGNATLKVNLPPAQSLQADNGVFIDDSVSSMAPFLPTNQTVPQGLYHDADIFGVFKGILLQLWLLWELLIIGEPILLIAPTPPQCCEAVASLVSLVAPLLCSVDFRPYFTIHDRDFAKLNSLGEGDPFPPMILGVTNLFFLKALRDIPHIVSVGSPASNSTRQSLAPKSSFATRSRSESFGLNQLSKRFSPSNILGSVKLRRDGPLCLMTEHKEAIWSTYSATTKPDTSILNRLIDAGMCSRVEESMSVVNNEMLRRHFLELTTNFLAPFGPYFRATTPSEGTSPFVDPPPLSSFNADEFLQNLSARGPGKFLSKRMRGNWLDLYRRFLKGHNFLPWFQRRRSVAQQEQFRLWKQARIRTEIQPFLSKMHELEIVDSFNAIERHLLGELQSGKGSADAICQKLRGDLQVVFNVLPKDMQQLLLFNPHRASLLQGDVELTRLPGHPSVQVGIVSPSSPP